MIIVTRNMRDYGPYDEQTVASFVREGRLLLHDKARDAATGREGTVEYVPKRPAEARYRNSLPT